MTAGTFTYDGGHFFCSDSPTNTEKSEPEECLSCGA